MQRRKFGNTEVEVSVLGLDCQRAGLDRTGHFSEEQAIRLMHCASDQGITFFDSGDARDGGRSELVLGKFLKSAMRQQIQIAGRFGYDNRRSLAESSPEWPQDFSPRSLHLALEQSLHRLGTDYIDVYMAQDLRLPQFRDELFSELEKIKAQGKVRVWGLSLGPGIGWREEAFSAILDRNAKVVQTVFNLFEQNPGREICELANACGAGVLVRGHDYHGILKGAVETDSGRGHASGPGGDASWKLYALKKLQRIREYADARGLSVHQLACRWLLMHGAVTSIVAKFLNEHEIREAADSTDSPALSIEEMSRIARDYASDWDLGPEAHPCDLNSSVEPGGKVRSSYVAPPVVLA